MGHLDGSGTSPNFIPITESTIVVAMGERLLEDLPIILVVEDDQLVQGLFEEALTEARFEPAIVSSAEEAASSVFTRVYDAHGWRNNGNYKLSRANELLGLGRIIGEPKCAGRP